MIGSMAAEKPDVMRSFETQRWRRKCSSILVLAIGAVLTQSGFAQAPHLTVPVSGGMPGLPVMTDIQSVGTNQVEVRWEGPAGFYRLMRKLDLMDPQWDAAGPWNASRANVVTAMQEKEFFRVIGPSPSYAGSQSCSVCHSNIHASEMQTRHVGALETLKQIGQGNNSSCLPCHTVGYQLPTGFTTESETPYLAGVQCENCHGPAGPHVADPFDLTVRPRIEIAGQMCGGCHTDSHHPTYDEWSTSGHADVVEDMNGGRIDRCGRCHSGSSRLAQLDGEDPALTVEGDANMGITCVVCHDPHQNTPYGHQLRNPIASTNDYFITTSGSATAGGGLLDQYNAGINLCAQCHNHRGAQWDGSGSRPPHHSPQYNMLLSTVGELPQGMTPWSATHAGSKFVTNDLQQVIAVTNQCVTCHMQTEDHQDGPPEVAADTGHKFRVDSYRACLGCHQPLVDPERGEDLVAGLVDLVQTVLDFEILYTKALLDEWGVSSAPPAIASYEELAWEYENSGDLSEGDGPPVGADGQDQIPDNIKKARFNLYLVLYDGSMGVHNTFHALDLLSAAQDWIRQEMMNVEE